MRHPKKAIQRTELEKQRFAANNNTQGLAFAKVPALQKKDNSLEMRDTLRSGMEAMSGMDMAEIKAQSRFEKPGKTSFFGTPMVQRMLALKPEKRAEAKIVTLEELKPRVAE